MRRTSGWPLHCIECERIQHPRCRRLCLSEINSYRVPLSPRPSRGIREPGSGRPLRAMPSRRIPRLFPDLRARRPRHSFFASHSAEFDPAKTSGAVFGRLSFREILLNRLEGRCSMPFFGSAGRHRAAPRDESTEVDDDNPDVRSLFSRRRANAPARLPDRPNAGGVDIEETEGPRRQARLDARARQRGSRLRGSSARPGLRPLMRFPVFSALNRFSMTRRLSCCSRTIQARPGGGRHSAGGRSRYSNAHPHVHRRRAMMKILGCGPGGCRILRPRVEQGPFAIPAGPRSKSASLLAPIRDARFRKIPESRSDAMDEMPIRSRRETPVRTLPASPRAEYPGKISQAYKLVNPAPGA